MKMMPRATSGLKESFSTASWIRPVQCLLIGQLAYLILLIVPEIAANALLRFPVLTDCFSITLDFHAPSIHFSANIYSHKTQNNNYSIELMLVDSIRHVTLYSSHNTKFRII